METQATYETVTDPQWAIVELMGHKVVAGKLTKTEMFGEPMLRIDVPTTDAFPAFTQLYGKSAVYCITFTSEEVAQLAAQQAAVDPVSIYTPELVTKDQFEEVKDALRTVQIKNHQQRQEMEQLKQKALAPPSADNSEEGIPF